LWRHDGHCQDTGACREVQKRTTRGWPASPATGARRAKRGARGLCWAVSNPKGRISSYGAPVRTEVLRLNLTGEQSAACLTWKVVGMRISLARTAFFACTRCRGVGLPHVCGIAPETEP
jgi:hypothetical protein